MAANFLTLGHHQQMGGKCGQSILQYPSMTDWVLTLPGTLNKLYWSQQVAEGDGVQYSALKPLSNGKYVPTSLSKIKDGIEPITREVGILCITHNTIKPEIPSKT